MKPPKLQRAHGGVRGANLSRSSLLFDGPFGRIFRVVPPADFGLTEQANLDNFTALATAMNGNDPEKDGSDAEESGIPSAYTYFGQFIDHDLTFDPASSLQKQNDPDALVDYRTPRFDLDCVYGRGPDDQPYMYNDSDGGRTLVRGTALSGAASNPNATDLPRAGNAAGGAPLRAIIGDPRNDENVIVSQLQGLMHRFHNRVAKDNPDWEFARVQQEVRFHYQWVVLYDFLSRVVQRGVLEKVLPKRNNLKVTQEFRLEFFNPKNEAFMPLEFSAAAYRFGHSMVRPGYRLNDDIPVLPLFSGNDTDPDLRGFQPPISTWAIDWNRYIDLQPLPDGPTETNRLQLAYKIDTSLVNPLFHLPPRVAPADANVLAMRNLVRGWRMRLPSGQDVARAMGVPVLKDDDLVIGKLTGETTDVKGPIHTFGDGKSFKNNCPLWIYCLAETAQNPEPVPVKILNGSQVVEKKVSTPKLGEVGGRIVAEVIAGLLKADSSSFVSLDPLWTPTRDVGTTRTVSYAGSDGKFQLRDLIRAALQD